MNLEIFIREYWYFISGSIILFLLYLKYSKNEKIGDISNSDLAMIIEAGFYTLLIMVIQDTYFNSHVFFILSLIIFIPIWALIIYTILNRGNYYLIEARIQGQEFYELGIINENPSIDSIVTNNTGILLHVMDKEVFENMKHYGNDFSPRYNVANQIKFCDYFNGKTIFHPEYPDLQNISFWARIVEFVELKNLVPDLIRENLELTDLANVRIYKNIKTIRNNLKTTLTGLETQWKHNPYSIQDKLSEFVEKMLAEKHKSQSESESKEAKNLSENSNKGESNE